jgi:flagellin-like protein
MLKRGVFRSKRGMSPLIATVLLIAFAVAMGAMIMNWSSSLGQSLADEAPDCLGVRLVENPVICYAENIINLKIRNEGDVVEDLTVTVSDENSENDLNLKNSRLRRGDELSKEIPFKKTSQTYVGITPSVDNNGVVAKCEYPVLEIDDLPDCQA